MTESREPIEVVRAVKALTIEGQELVSVVEEASREKELPSAFAESLRYYSRDVEWDMGPRWAGIGIGHYRGHAGIAKFWTDFLAVFSEFRVKTVSLAEAGDQVVCEAELSFTTRNGLTMEGRQGEIWTVRDGEVTRLRLFEDREAAVAALDSPAGL